MIEEQKNDRDGEDRGEIETDVVELPLSEVSPEDVDMEEELAKEELFDTQRGEGHTYNPHHAAEQGLTYTPPTDPPIVASEDDPQGVEIAAGFAPSMEDAGPDVRDLPEHLDDNDLHIKEGVQEVLRYNSETAHLTEIAVVVRDGVVYLRGPVSTMDDEVRVNRIVAELDGVVRVVSNLWVEK